MLNLVDVENPHDLNADNDWRQNATFQTGRRLVLNRNYLSRQDGEPFDIVWGWHGPACSQPHHSCRCSQSSDHNGEPSAHKDQSRRWTQTLQMMRLSNCSTKAYLSNSRFPCCVFFYLVMKHKKNPNVNKLSRAINYLSKQWGKAICWATHFDFDLVLPKSENQLGNRWFPPQLLNWRTWRIKWAPPTQPTSTFKSDQIPFYLWHSRTQMDWCHRIIQPDSIAVSICRLVEFIKSK